MGLKIPAPITYFVSNVHNLYMYCSLGAMQYQDTEVLSGYISNSADAVAPVQERDKRDKIYFTQLSFTVQERKLNTTLTNINKFLCHTIRRVQSLISLTSICCILK